MALKSFAEGRLFGSARNSGSLSVLALHGWGRTHRDFDTVLDGFPAIAIDLPGFGASPAPTEVWGADEYADVVRDVCDVFEAPPIVVGHSFGGRVAVTLAARYPESVASLILIGVPLLHPSDRRPAGTPRGYRLARWAHRRGLLAESRMEAARQKYGSADYRSAEGVMRDILVKAVNETYESALDAMSVPVHLLWGANDTAAPVSVAREVERRLSARGAEVSLDVVEDVGHHVMLEAPDVVRECIAARLGERA